MDFQLRRQEDTTRERRRLRKGMYLLPSLFTMGNIAAGYYAILQALQGSGKDFWYFDNAAIRSGHPVRHFDLEAVAIGSHGGEIEPSDDVGPVGAKARGRIGQGQRQDPAGVTVAPARQGTSVA